MAAFTMVEIALSLAVIGFALVAIIGVLPAGMSVQRDNREETLINFDSAFLIDSLRSGASNTFGLGQNDLTNYVLAITNISTVCDTNGAPDGAFTPRTNWFTTTNYSLNGTVTTSNLLTNSAIIVGLLSTPKYISFFPNQGGPRIISNLVTADFRTISGAAVDQGASKSSRDFAFSYRVTVEVIPSGNYPFFDPNWVNVTGANGVLPNRPVLGIALDPSVAAANIPVGYAAVGGFNANTPTTPGHVFQVTCAATCGSFAWLDKTGNLPDIPVDSVIVNPNFPQQVFAGTDWGVYYTNDVTVASPLWYRFENGLPHAMIWDMQIDRGATTLSVWTRGRGAFAYPLSSSPIVTPTSLAVSPATGIYGGTTDLSATLTAGGSGVSGESISFTLNSSPVGSATTNGSGVATLSSQPADKWQFCYRNGHCSNSGTRVLELLRAQPISSSLALSSRNGTFGPQAPMPEELIPLPNC